MKQVRFEESEVPYQTLARFGLTQEKIEDLPMWALEVGCGLLSAVGEITIGGFYSGTAGGLAGWKGYPCRC